ncbi:MAG TPA: transposase, partial [Bacteroidales bacterium]|nr:transposase [Bacteroidales bacterium]
FKQYKTKACRKCPVRSQCTRSEKERLIQRSEFAEYYERNLINTLEKEHLYKRRQAIVEHPYGTIKRQWGFSYILTKKGMKRASADVGFIFIAYNLRRIGNILTLNVLKEYLRMLISLFLSIKDLVRPGIDHSKTLFPRLSVWNNKFPGLLIPA